MTGTTGGRRDALAASLTEVDAVLVAAPVDVRYLTGFTGSNAAVLVARDGSCSFATDGRYVEQAAREVPDLDVVDARKPAPALASGAPSGWSVGIDADHVTLADFDQLRAAVGRATRLVAAPNPVMPLRMVKDVAEVDSLRRACQATDAAFDHVVSEVLRTGVEEREVAWAIEAEMRRHGATGASFESIVAFGPHSAVPHHQPTGRSLSRGDLVTLDIGALVDGYHADMTRTVVLGTPAGWQQELHAMVLDVQDRCLAAAVPGASAADLQHLAGDLVRAHGHRLVHGLGHGVGLEIHEDPFLTPEASTLTLAADMTITIEPGIYLPGRGGVRIEDTVLLCDGAPTALTTAGRELMVL